jgi:hypothetical protein
MATTSPVLVEMFEQPVLRCPMCGVFAICKLHPILRSKQPDDTTHACNPAHGGCNQGFTLESSQP